MRGPEPTVSPFRVDPLAWSVACTLVLTSSLACAPSDDEGGVSGDGVTEGGTEPTDGSAGSTGTTGVATGVATSSTGGVSATTVEVPDGCAGAFTIENYGRCNSATMMDECGGARVCIETSTDDPDRLSVCSGCCAADEDCPGADAASGAMPSCIDGASLGASHPICVLVCPTPTSCPADMTCFNPSGGDSGICVFEEASGG